MLGSTAHERRRRLARHHLRFAPKILTRLGEELVPHPDMGIMELVRNAYDADATECSIELVDSGRPGGSIVVSDNGHGMTDAELTSDFLLIGSSRKPSSPFTRSGRRRVGEKGLGRLAALRLGRRVKVTTRSEETLGVQYTLGIDWDELDSARAVEDVALELRDVPPHARVGTRIEIHDLRQGLSVADVGRLTRSLTLLTGPFQAESTFKILWNQTAFGHEDLTSAVTDEHLHWAEFHLSGRLGVDGSQSAELRDHRGHLIGTATADDLRSAAVGGRRRSAIDGSQRLFTSAPAAKFDLWMFNLNPRHSVALRDSIQPTPEIKSWLADVGGVHLYHHGLRVQPYGDPDDDWLSINVRRAVLSEFRPYTNNSVGALVVNDPEDRLQPKTDRSGFVQNAAFGELREFARSAIEWASQRRRQIREAERQEQRKRAKAQTADAEAEFTEAKKALEEQLADNQGRLDGNFDRASVQRILTTSQLLADQRLREIKDLHSELLLYRALATVGTSTAVFAHEAQQPADRILQEVRTVDRRARRDLDPAIVDDRYKPSLSAIADGARTLQIFAQLPLELLVRKKRDLTYVDIDEVCLATLQMFHNFMSDRGIHVTQDLNCQNLRVRTYEAAVESIVSNLLVNSIHALTRTDGGSERRIHLSTCSFVDKETQWVRLIVDDSGPGIQDASTEEIWVPGFTTRDGGTGLGLTIVRDTVGDMLGRQEAVKKGPLGGARLLVELPASAAATPAAEITNDEREE